jgi:Trk K+ transport system NAD-binding subunit
VLRDSCHIVSIRRNGRVVIPQGDTRIKGGDIIVAYVYPEAHQEVVTQFKQPVS